MPKKPLKRLIRGVPGDLNHETLLQLIKGFTFYSPELPDADLEPIYRKNQDFLLSLVGKNIRRVIPAFPLRGKPIPWGTRHASWWKWSAPEPRLVISGDPSGIIPGCPSYFGIPSQYKSIADYDQLEFETQYSYLERHGFLTKEEARRYDPQLLRPWKK